MSLEAYASAKRDEIHTDVLLQARQACYKARDAFYSCLEKHSDKKPTEIGSVGLLYPTECKPSREDYVKNCRVSWVKHFDRQYCKTKRTQRLLDDKETRRGKEYYEEIFAGVVGCQVNAKKMLCAPSAVLIGCEPMMLEICWQCCVAKVVFLGEVGYIFLGMLF